MTTQFFNTFRSSTNLKSSASSIMMRTAIPNEIGTRKTKLKNLIILNLSKKHGLKHFHPLVAEEVETFLHCKNLNDRDLKNLESRIKYLLEDEGIRLSKSVESNERVISTAPGKQTIMNSCASQAFDTERIKLSNFNTVETGSSNPDMNLTKMSHQSNLSEVFKSKGLLKRNDPVVPEEDLIKPKRIPHQFEFDHEEDLWNAFNNVNRRLYEQERIDEKKKDKEIKMRTKEDLDNQIRHKLLKIEEERSKNLEYHDMMIQHIDQLNRIEEDKQSKIKQKILKEKENRDKQVWDQNYRRKIEKIKLRKYENEFLSQVNSEIKNEKSHKVLKKIEANNSLKRTLEENDKNRKEKERMLDLEHMEDMKSMEEYNKILEKQENDRKLYFQNIEMKSSDFTAKVTETVLKDLKIKNTEKDRRMDDYLKTKEDQEKESDHRRIENMKQQKKEMKRFLDMQVQEKKLLSEFEKDLDKEQAMIIKKDCELYEQHKRIVNEKLRNMNQRNCSYLKEQIDLKKEAHEMTKLSKRKFLQGESL